MINAPQHTPEPLKVRYQLGSFCLVTKTKDVAVMEDTGDDSLTEIEANRIAACYNACAGIANPEALPEVLEALKDFRAKRTRSILTKYGEPEFDIRLAEQAQANQRLIEALIKLEGRV